MGAPERASGTLHRSVEVEIRGLASDGAGVGRMEDGRALFVHRTAPGDRIQARVTRSRRNWARGKLERVVTEGPDRRSAPCPRYLRCGGCVLEHLAYPAQLRAKASRVAETLRRVGGLQDLPPVEAHAAPREFRYRNRASFLLRRLGQGRVVAGLHELERPGRIVDLGGECLLLEEGVARAWDGIRRAWGPGATRLPKGDRLRLTVRATADAASLLLVEGGDAPGEPEGLMEAVPGLRAVWWRPDRDRRGRAGPGSPEATRPPPVLLAGEETLEESWLGERIPIRPGAFLQVNREAAELLHGIVVEALQAGVGERVLDAYCGYGAYGRAAARAGARVVGIERSAEAVAMAEARPIDGMRVLSGSVESRIGETLPADRAVLNPPRQGAAEGVIEALVKGVERRIVYVSCDPATLARDLARLGGAFQVERVQVVDLFPQTAHVETVVTMSPAATARV